MMQTLRTIPRNHHPFSFISTSKTIFRSPTLLSPSRNPRFCHRRSKWTPLSAVEEKEEQPVAYNKDFGYSRKDVLVIGGLMIGTGFGCYYGLQFLGVDELQAGTYAQLIVFVGILMTWVSTYLFRVSNKSTTYVTQLKQYEEAVMQKRLDEMTDTEIEVLMKEVEQEKREAIQKERNTNP